MQAKCKAAVPVAQDQWWKVNGSYVQIVRLGKRLIHYRMSTRLQNRAVPVKMTSIDTLQNYLKSNRAVLVKGQRPRSV